MKRSIEQWIVARHCTDTPEESINEPEARDIKVPYYNQITSPYSESSCSDQWQRVNVWFLRSHAITPTSSGHISPGQGQDGGSQHVCGWMSGPSVRKSLGSTGCVDCCVFYKLHDFFKTMDPSPWNLHPLCCSFFFFRKTITLLSSVTSGTKQYPSPITVCRLSSPFLSLGTGIHTLLFSLTRSQNLLSRMNKRT